MALTLQQWCNYLPHGVKVSHRVFPYKFGTYIKSELGLETKTGFIDLRKAMVYDDNKPHLRPLSSLTKTISVENYNEGKPFIPIVELAKMFYKNPNYAVTHYENVVQYHNGICSVNCCVENDSSRYAYYQINILEIGDIRYKDIQQLLQWHFSLDIPEGSYIEIID